MLTMPQTVLGYEPEGAGTPLQAWLKAYLPRTYFVLWQIHRLVMYRGWRFLCPVCDTKLRRWMKTEDQCPVCRSHARDRMLWLWMATETQSPRRPTGILHFAPETALGERLQRLAGVSYVTADIVSPRVDVHCDAEHLPFADESFDVVLCNHVLQYVHDDHAALSELARVMRPDGWASVLVPFSLEYQTVESSSDLPRDERVRRFGPDAPWRLYGLDLSDRLGRSGLALRCERYAANMGHESTRFGLNSDEFLLIALKT